MAAPSPTDEQLKDRAIEQAWAGDFISARQTTKGIVTREHLQDAWQTMFNIQKERGDVQGIKELIVACPDASLLETLPYREFPLDIAKTGDVFGAIEIAETMGRYGALSLLLIPSYLATTGDIAGARKAASRIKDEGIRDQSMKLLEQLHENQSQEKVNIRNI